MATLKKGSSGEAVQGLQTQLQSLGYPVNVTGDFDALTLWAVHNVQAMFGYTVDGLVGPATTKLIESQVGYGWSATNDDALTAALAAQGLSKG